MKPETRKLISKAFLALGPAPSYEALELVVETLHAAGDQGVEDAFAGAADRYFAKGCCFPCSMDAMAVWWTTSGSFHLSMASTSRLLKASMARRIRSIPSCDIAHSVFREGVPLSMQSSSPVD